MPTLCIMLGVFVAGAALGAFLALEFYPWFRR